MNIAKHFKRRRLLGVTAVIAAAVVLAGCTTPTGGETGGPSDGPVYGGELVVAEGGSWPTLDPHTVNTNAGPFEHVFETLFSYHMIDQDTGEHELTGLLAESWNNDDPMVLEIVLRQGIKFTDGSDWNAEVAKFNLDRIRTTKEGIGYANSQTIDSVDVVDDYTIRLNLKNPDPALLIHLSQAPGVGTSMISEAAFEAGGDDVQKFQGTGAFKVEEFRLDDQTTVVKNEGYWRKDADGNALPYLDGINFRVLQDRAVVLTELQAGTVNLAGNMPATELKTIEQNPSLVYVPYEGALLMPGYMGFNTTSGAFADVNVRQAAMRAIDRQVLADTVGYDAVPQQIGYFGPASIGWDDALNDAWPYDPEEAKALLAGATPTGTITFQAREPDQTIATIIQQMWADVGIQVELLPAEEATWAENMKSSNFDVSLWGAFVPPDPALALPAFSCGGSYNWSQYCNEELEEVYRSGGAVYDPAERAAIYQDALGIVADEAPFGPMYATLRNAVITSNVQNLGRNWYFYDLNEAWIAE